jgi:hypothetical protein
VAIVRNGQRLAPGGTAGVAGSDGDAVTVRDLFDCAVEVEVAGVRWSVNEGARLAAGGRAAKRGLIRSYAYGFGGALVLLAACLWFWRRIIPADSQRSIE